MHPVLFEIFGISVTAYGASKALAAAGAWLQHVAAVVLDALSWLPGWGGALLVFGALAVIVTVAVRQSTGSGRTGAAGQSSADASNDIADDDDLNPSSPAATPHPMEIP